MLNFHHGIEIPQRYEENKVLGAYLYDQESKVVKKYMAKFTILATGGVGALYLHHTNSEGARGDGHAMAKRAGAQVIDMEFIQFHPTTFYGGSTHRRFLISEAVRGEGGVLINSKGERFMRKYSSDLELASRDIVARAIAEEIIISQNDCVYLDITHKPQEWVKTRFPTIYKHCLEHDVDITREPIPVVPAAHYTCGGVKTDLNGRTTISHLYAVGEVACTGLHGANRLASTSLLEGLSFGAFAARDIEKRIDSEEIYSAQKIREWVDGTKEVDTALIQQDWLTLKQTMWNYVGLTRSRDRLIRANAMFRELKDEIDRFYKDAKLVDSLIGLRNSVEVAQMVLTASLRNNKSVGCFYRKS
jgi:L-aspartate oxidase